MVEYVWVDIVFDNLKIVSEVKMDGFGNVDFVIVDINDDGGVNWFLFVEF